jgi:hypothetical protein
MSVESVVQAREDSLLPHAKREHLVIRENPDELLVYDLSNHKAHCLNKSAALTWTHCDGTTTVADLVAILSRELNVQVDEDVVWLALRQLDKARLLQGPVGRPEAVINRSRRDVVRKLGLGGALAVPVVMSIIAPKASAAATLVNGAPCTNNNQCTSGCCDRQVVNVCAADSGAAGGTRLPGVPCSSPAQCCTNSCATTCQGT